MTQLPKCKLHIDDHGILHIQGEVSFVNIKKTCLEGEKLLKTLTNIQVDLSGITKSDSSGLAMLICWVRRAKAQQKSITFLHFPQFMLDLGRVCGLDAILPVHIN